MKLNLINTLLILVSFILLHNSADTQKLVEVTVSNNKFTPANITVEVGDTVKWTNIQGNHNVNGKTTTFSSNPESFGNTVGTGWVYTHVFTIEGTYNYQCDPHASFGMTGTVNVSGPTEIFSFIENEKTQIVLKVFPIPSNEFIIFEFSEEVIKSNIPFELAVIDVSGKEIYKNININNTQIRVDISHLESSIYFYQLTNNSEIVNTGRFIKK